MDTPEAMISEGCATGAGCFPLLKASLDQLQTRKFKDYSELQQILKETYDLEAPKIKSWWKQDFAQIDRTTILISKADGQTFRLYAYNFLNQPTLQGSYFLITPPEFQGSTNQLKSNFVEKLQGSFGIGFVIRCLAQLFHQVYLASRTVSDRLDLILLSFQGQYVVKAEGLMENNKRLLPLNDSQIENLLKPV